MQDSIIELHTFANLAPLIGDDGRDIGIHFHYYKGADSLAFLGWENDTQTLIYLQSASETSSNVTGTYGNVQFGSLLLSNTTAASSPTTGALQVRGGVGVSGAVYTGGLLDIQNNTQAVSTTTGALMVDGGGSFTTGNVYIGGSGGNAIISTGDIYNNGNIWATGATNTGLKTNQTTAYVFNETATTVRIGGAATTVSVGATTGAIIPNANAAVNLGSSTAFYGTTFTGNIVSNAAVVGGGGFVNAGTAIHRGNTQATNTTSGTMQVTGGMSIATGNLYIGGSAGTAIVATGNIVPSANVTSTNNIGSDTAWWNNFYGVATQARYADLAENYLADLNYEPGTVLAFGGPKEVTIAGEETTRVAGVVSTNPAHLMNGALKGSDVVPLALQGRVPCKVIGPIRKGDMMVAAGHGYAKASITPKLGSIIGKALEDFDRDKGVIEIVVGRL